MATTNHTHAQFQTTRWSLVDALSDDDPQTRRIAEERIAKIYWPPIYGWFRRKGLSQADAADATQAFFSDVIMTRKLFVRADQNRSGLRTLLVTALRNYLVDRHRRVDSRPKVVDLPPPNLDAEDRFVDSDLQLSPEAAFDRRWAMLTLEHALRLCERQYEGRPTAKHWKAFEICILNPAIYGTESAPRAQVASELGFTDAASLSAALHAVRLKVRAVIQQVVDEANPDPAESETEHLNLLGMFGIIADQS